VRAFITPSVYTLVSTGESSLDLLPHPLPNGSMPYLSPQTLTNAEQTALLTATSIQPREHLIFSLALGTGLRLAELVGLNVGDVYLDGAPPSANMGETPGSVILV